MELVEGATLSDRIAQGPIPVDEALPIAHAIRGSSAKWPSRSSQSHSPLIPSGSLGFQREAEVLASLNHPHIAAIYGLEEARTSAGPPKPRRGCHEGRGHVRPYLDEVPDEPSQPILRVDDGYFASGMSVTLT